MSLRIMWDVFDDNEDVVMSDIDVKWLKYGTISPFCNEKISLSMRLLYSYFLRWGGVFC